MNPSLVTHDGLENEGLALQALTTGQKQYLSQFLAVVEMNLKGH